MNQGLKLRQTLRHKLAMQMIGITLLLAAIFSAVGLLLQYLLLINQMNQSINVIEQTHVPLISNMLYVYHYDELDALLKGLEKQDYISSITVTNPTQAFNQQWGTPNNTDEFIEFELQHTGQFGTESLGILSIQANKRWLYAQLWFGLSSALLPLLLLAFSVGISTSWLIRKKLFTHLENLVQQSDNIDHTSKLTHFSLARSNTEEDELSILVNALNDLVKRASSSMKSRDEAIAKLELNKDFLELSVQERTHDLVLAKEEAEQASVAKSNFIANMSHEIRTPMNGIMGLVELCLRTPLTPQQQDYLHKTQDSSKNLMLVINQILDFSKMDAGQFTLEHVEFNLNQVLSNVCNLYLASCQKKSLNLLLETNIASDVRCSGDPVRLSQILNNLINNALKFTASGSITLNVQLENETLHFSISDTGVGIETDNLSRLFEAFTQADESTTREYGGTGLGLKIASDLVNLMGGQLEVESQINEGTRFFFSIELPVHKQNIKQIDWPEGKRLLIIGERTPRCQNLCSMAKVANIPFVYSQTLNPNLEAHGFALLSFDSPLPDTYLPSQLISQNSPFSQPLLPFKFAEQLTKWLEHTQAALPEENDIPSYAGIKILLVEDNEINMLIAESILEQSECEVETAINGQLALDKLADNRYDIVLMDIQMPVMDGFEAINIIRATEALAHNKVIALTALESSDEVKHCLDAGFDGHLSKPIELEALYKALQQGLA